MLSQPTDPVCGMPAGIGAKSVVDFWRWAFSDLCDDDIKGWLAEWYVGLLLDLPMTRRVSWANSDLIAPNGARIEVKASAHWQSWKRVSEDGSAKVVEPLVPSAVSRVRFGGLRAGDSVTISSAPAALKSHLYVFAFQAQLDPNGWDALNLDHWEFYMLERSVLDALAVKSISLTRLRTLSPTLSAEAFRAAGKEWLAAFGPERAP